MTVSLEALAMAGVDCSDCKITIQEYEEKQWQHMESWYGSPRPKKLRRFNSELPFLSYIKNLCAKKKIHHDADQESYPVDNDSDAKNYYLPLNYNGGAANEEKRKISPEEEEEEGVGSIRLLMRKFMTKVAKLFRRQTRR